MIHIANQLQQNVLMQEMVLPLTDREF